MTTKTTKNEIITPHPHDVLLGRGGLSILHEGNISFRKWVGERREGYRETKDPALKLKISTDIFAQVKGLVPPGRFLNKSSDTKNDRTSWFEIEESKAISKIKQSLRDALLNDVVGKKRKAPTESMPLTTPTTVRYRQNFTPLISSKRILRSSTRIGSGAAIENQSFPLDTQLLDENPTQIVTISKDKGIKTLRLPSGSKQLNEETSQISAMTTKLESPTPFTPTCVLTNLLLNHSFENDLVSEDSVASIAATILTHDLHASSVTPDLYIEDPMVLSRPLGLDLAASTISTASLKLTKPMPGLPRSNSLALSEISMDESLDAQEEDFTNPFDDDEIFEIIQGLLMQDFPSMQSNIDTDEPLPYDAFETTNPTMSFYKLNVIHSDQEVLNVENETQTLPLHPGMLIDTPSHLATNVIENEDSIESLDHDLSAWMILDPHEEPL